MGSEPVKLTVITLWQPWASLCFAGRKMHETRSWPYPWRLHGQRIGIHAAAKFPALRLMSEELHELCLDEFGCSYNYTLPLGCVIGTAILDRCVSTSGLDFEPSEDDRIAGNWEPGRFAWRLRDTQRWPVPLPAKGQQGWWSINSPALAGESSHG